MSPAISTTTVTVNAAFLQEIKQVNEELWQTLKEVRQRAESQVLQRADAWRFLHQLAQLRDQLAFHFTLEEAYGYFEDPIDVAPRLCRQANQLRSEHRELYLMVVDLGEASELLTQRNRISGTVMTAVKQFQAFDERLHRHESLENELIMQEYGDDIGVGD